MKQQPILAITGLTKKRPQEHGTDYTLSVPSLRIFPGEKVLLTGQSGCGKSTLLDLLGMVLRPDAVQEQLFCPQTDGTTTTCDAAQAWRSGDTESLALWRRHIGYVLQTGGLLPFITVHENICTPRKLLGLPEDSFPDMLADRMNITHLLAKYPSQLSVGERQRVAIARALAAKPALILADEPTAALDPTNAATVLDLFTELVETLGLTLILVSHAPEQVKGNFRKMHVTVNMCDDAGHSAILHDMSDGGSVCAS